MPRRAVFLILLLLGVVLLLLGRISQLSSTVEQLEQAAHAHTLRHDATRHLLDKSLQRLTQQAPSEAQLLQRELRMLEHGDPRLLQPSEHVELRQIFDELL